MRTPTGFAVSTCPKELTSRSVAPDDLAAIATGLNRSAREGLVHCASRRLAGATAMGFFPDGLLSLCLPLDTEGLAEAPG